MIVKIRKNFDNEIDQDKVKYILKKRGVISYKIELD